MLVTSRHPDEYRAFFDLSEADLSRRILDCSAGASGFAAAVNGAGGDVVAVDPAYADLDRLRSDVTASEAGGVALIDRNEDAFTWHWYGSPERRRELRAQARTDFLKDLSDNPHTYVPGALPHLPLPDDAVDLALCSHLLFTWAGAELDDDFHRAALAELLRVAPEVRIFPLVRQGDGAVVDFLPRLLDEVRDAGHHAEHRKVPYEFQVGADSMLVLRRGRVEYSP